MGGDFKLLVTICSTVPFPLFEMCETIDMQQRHRAVELAAIM